MDNIETRLTQCFLTVFPQVPRHEIPQAAAGTVEEWDSLNLVTLIAVVEEEFGITLDAADLQRLDSYSSILQVIQREVARRSRS